MMEAGDYERSLAGDEEDQEEDEEVTYAAYNDEYEYDEDAESRRSGFKYFSIYTVTGFLHGIALLGYLVIGAVFFKKFEEGEMATSLDNLQNAQDGLYWTLDNAKKSLKNGLGPQNKKEFIETISKHLAVMEMKWEGFHRKRQGDAKENIWTYFGSFIFCSSVVTTIGWGNIAPRTKVGRIGCIVFAVFGIPIFFGFAVMLSNISNTACQMIWKAIETAMGSTMENIPGNTKYVGNDTNVNKSDKGVKGIQTHVLNSEIKRQDVFKTLLTMPVSFKTRVQNGVVDKTRDTIRYERNQCEYTEKRMSDSPPLTCDGLNLSPTITLSKSCHTIYTMSIHQAISVRHSKSSTNVCSQINKKANTITCFEDQACFKQTIFSSSIGSDLSIFKNGKRGNDEDSNMIVSDKSDSVKIHDAIAKQRIKENKLISIARHLTLNNRNQNAEEDDDDDDDDDDSNLFDDDPDEEEPTSMDDNVPFIVYSTLFLIYLLIGGYLFEDLDTKHTLINGIYFTFIMLTTIGFGDIVPMPQYYIAMLIYGALGLSLTNLITNMIIDKIVDIVDTVNTYWEKKINGHVIDHYGYGEYEEGEEVMGYP